MPYVNKCASGAKLEWVMDRSHRDGIPSFLPAGFDTSNLVDITTITDPFRVYFDSESGKTFRGADYHAQSQAELDAGPSFKDISSVKGA